jgi:histidinol-phosphate/aromatic aminotransferase/cobyric acid decarboxylase-like protein
MRESNLNRRQFAQTVGAVIGGAAILPELVPGVVAPAGAAPQHSPRSSDGAIEIDSNENPYGPSPRARDAITNSENIACRYPDATEGKMVDAIAKFHRVASE